jgi:two-component system response regulator AtoC
MVRRMVVLGSEQAVIDEIAKSKGAAAVDVEESNNSPDLTALGADFSDSAGIDLKAISRRAAQIAEKRVIERVLHQTRWNRKAAAARLQISYKALLYKMKENGLSERR